MATAVNLRLDRGDLWQDRTIDRENHPALLRLSRRKAVGGLTQHFTTIAVFDFEYEVEDGELPDVLCLVAYILDEHLRLVRKIRMWRGDFGSSAALRHWSRYALRRLQRVGGDDMLHGARLGIPGPCL